MQALTFDLLNLFLLLLPLPQLPLSSAYSAMADAPLSHDTKLAKQRARLDSRHHEPLFTNVTKDFRGTLDYILYTNTSLRPTAVLELPLLDGEVRRKSDSLFRQSSLPTLCFLMQFIVRG